MNEYNPPKWKYHPTLPPVLVKDDVAEAKLGAGWVDSYIHHEFPKCKYRSLGIDPETKKLAFESMEVESKDEEDELGPEWVNSPAEIGVETCPGRKPDQVILAKQHKQSEKAAKKVDARVSA